MGNSKKPKPGLYYVAEFNEVYEILEVNGCYLFAFGPGEVHFININSLEYVASDPNEVWIGKV